MQELRQLLLQGLVNILRPADKTDRTHSKAMALQGCVGRLQHFGVAAEAQVVVGTKIQHFAAIRQGDHGVLGRCNNALALEQSLLLDRLQLLLQSGIKSGFSSHIIQFDHEGTPEGFPVGFPEPPSIRRHSGRFAPHVLLPLPPFYSRPPASGHLAT